MRTAKEGVALTIEIQATVVAAGDADPTAGNVTAAVRKWKQGDGEDGYYYTGSAWQSGAATITSTKKDGHAHDLAVDATRMAGLGGLLFSARVSSATALGPTTWVQILTDFETKATDTLDTNIDANETKIDAIQTDVTSIESKIDIVDSNVDTVNTATVAIQAKTDNLPGSPAAVGSAMTLSAAALTAVEDEVLDALTSGHAGAGTIGKAIADGAVGILTGVRTITVTVEDQNTDPVPGIQVSVYDAANSVFVGRAEDDDLDGIVELNLDDGAYSIRLSALRFDPDSTPETLVVTADAAVTYDGTIFGVPTASSAGFCTVYGFLPDVDGDQNDGVEIEFWGNGPIGVDENQVTINKVSVVTGTGAWPAGYFEVELIREVEAAVRCGIAKLDSLVITVPDAASAKLATLTEAAKP